MAAQVQGISFSPAFTPQVGYKRLRAVVADDISDMRKITVGVLEHDGWVDVVGTTDNGVMAVELAEALLPDLVVLDINMPKMTGLEATWRIKQILPQMKILVVSADDDAEVALCALDCGADAFLWKGNLVKQCHTQLARMFMDEPSL